VIRAPRPVAETTLCEPSAAGVEVEFHDPVDPMLRPVGGVHVACHLYDEALRPVRSPDPE